MASWPTAAEITVRPSLGPQAGSERSAQWSVRGELHRSSVRPSPNMERIWYEVYITPLISNSQKWALMSERILINDYKNRRLLLDCPLCPYFRCIAIPVLMPECRPVRKFPKRRVTRWFTPTITMMSLLDREQLAMSFISRSKVGKC